MAGESAVAMKQFSIGLVIGVFLVGCTSTAVITQLTENQVVVRATHANQGQVYAEARRGCAFHGRNAVPMSNQCLDQLCSERSYLFACEGELASAGSRSSPWLGMSVDDVADHLYADPPGSSEVVITRIFADGPAKQAGFRVGDIIESLDGVKINDAMTLVDLKQDLHPGDAMAFGIRRGDDKLRVVMTAQSQR